MDSFRLSPTAVAVPLCVRAGEGGIPAFMRSTIQVPNNIKDGFDKKDKRLNAPICDLSLQVKRDIFPVTRGNGNKYFNYSLLWNTENTGWMQRIKPVEDYIFSEAEKIDWNKRGDNHAEYYSAVWERVKELYK